jgi:co-chaperonin GroES (HSP10)
MIEPVGHYVLVLPDDVTEEDELLKRTKESKIYIPEDIVKKEQAASTKGTLVAIGPQAWKAFDDGSKWAEVGDKVYFPRYNNRTIIDPETGIAYFLLSDDKILGKYIEGTK